MITDLWQNGIKPTVEATIQAVVGLGLEVRLMRRANDAIPSCVKYGVATAAITPSVGHMPILT